MSSRVFAQQLVDGAVFISGLFRPYCCVVSAETTSCRCSGAVWSARLNVDGCCRGSLRDVPTGACEDGRGRLFNFLGTTFRRWSPGRSPSFRLRSLGRSSSVSFWCCVSQWEEMKTSLVLIHQLRKKPIS